jgi:hypothetical protein
MTRARIDTRHHRLRQELVADIRWGIGWGLWIATGFSAIVLVLAGFRGSTDYPELGLSTGSIILIYFGLGLIAGCILGLLRPFTRTKSGGFFVGWLIGSLVYGGAGLMIKGVTLLMIPVAVILGLAVGGTLGYQTVGKRKSDRHAA